MLADARAPVLIAGPGVPRGRRGASQRLSPAPDLVVVGEDYERWLAAHEPRDPGGARRGRRRDRPDVHVRHHRRAQGRAHHARATSRWPRRPPRAGRSTRTPSASRRCPCSTSAGSAGRTAGSGTAPRRSSSASSTPRRVLDILERQRVTNAVLVPTMLQMLTAVPGAAERDYSALRSIAYGAAPITTPVLKAYPAHLRLRAVRPLRPDGEHRRRGRARAGGSRSRRPARAPAAVRRAAAIRGSSCGSSIPSAARPLGPREVGEVWLRGPNVTPGYFNRPAETAAALTPRRLAAHRRRRLPRRGGLPVPDRPDQGHDRERRRERLSGRGRGGARPARRRRRGGGHRRARPALGRGGQGAGRPAPGRRDVQPRT